MGQSSPRQLQGTKACLRALRLQGGGWVESRARSRGSESSNSGYQKPVSTRVNTQPGTFRPEVRWSTAARAPTAQAGAAYNAHCSVEEGERPCQGNAYGEPGKHHPAQRAGSKTGTRPVSADSVSLAFWSQPTRGLVSWAPAHLRLLQTPPPLLPRPFPVAATLVQP